MRKTFTVLLGLYFVAIIGLVQITTERNASAASGKSLYNSSCKSCHGKRGKGAACPNIRNESFKSLKKAVKNGAGSMPAFSSLKKSAIKSIWKYVKK